MRSSSVVVLNNNCCSSVVVGSLHSRNKIIRSPLFYNHLIPRTLLLSNDHNLPLFRRYVHANVVKGERMESKMVFEPVLEEGVFRFDSSGSDRDAASPSLSFTDTKLRDTPIMTTHEVPVYTPTFDCMNGQQIVSIELPTGTSFYGTGEVSGQLERTGKRSHPWVLSVLPSGEALGVLADTTQRYRPAEGFNNKIFSSSFISCHYIWSICLTNCCPDFFVSCNWLSPKTQPLICLMCVSLLL
ncbi:hypothetical protein IFM89_022625 [Coptis chinensis]|uniref:Uncharacterized protein n=1 Tax=Coptis chinensis TaxID=261450 RepID=A0A835LJI1_9MAGN|nr:hypothetical protein IFM89_022625 [Coptis chinensis]